MRTLDVDDTAQPKYVAALDAQAQHALYWADHDPLAKKQALAIRDLAVSAYWRSKVYLNARAKFIVVKVDRPHIADKLQNTEQLQELYNMVTFCKAEVVQTKNALLFRVK